MIGSGTICYKVWTNRDHTYTAYRKCFTLYIYTWSVNSTTKTVTPDKGQRRPLVKQSAPRQYNANFNNVNNIWLRTFKKGSTSRRTGWRHPHSDCRTNWVTAEPRHCSVGGKRVQYFGYWHECKYYCSMQAKYSNNLARPSSSYWTLNNVLNKAVHFSKAYHHT